MTLEEPLRLRGLDLAWGSRTFVMGILNVTPDSFSGDGLAHTGDRVDVPSAVDIPATVAQARRMVTEGADLLDIGGESTRPGHAPVDERTELARVVPVIRALRAALPDVPLSVDTTKAAVAVAALDAGADILNDVSGVTGDGTLARLAARRDVPYVLMHDAHVDTHDRLMDRVLTDLARARDRALAAGCRPGSLILDPGIGFGTDVAGNLAILRDLGRLRELGQPVLLGASRKSTIGRVLDLPVEERLEGTIALTVLGVAARVDMVRVHDVRANLRAARVADAVIRAWHDPPATESSRRT